MNELLSGRVWSPDRMMVTTMGLMQGYTTAHAAAAAFCVSLFGRELCQSVFRQDQERSSIKSPSINRWMIQRQREKAIPARDKIVFALWCL